MIDFNPKRLVINVSHGKLRRRHALLCGQPIPASRLFVILRTSETSPVHFADDCLGVDLSARRSRAYPVPRCFQILFNSDAVWKQHFESPLRGLTVVLRSGPKPVTGSKRTGDGAIEIDQT
jgi:hypothetical protein